MTPQNSQLIDPEQFVFSVLNLATVTLFRGVLWQSTDLTYATATGSLFHAYEEGASDPVASITLVDVSGDPTEPNISRFNNDDAARFDAQLKARIERQTTLVQWNASTLNEASGIKAMVTPYVALANGEEWQYIAIRTHQHNNAYVLLGAYAMNKSDTLGPQVLKALGSITFQDQRA